MKKTTTIVAGLCASLMWPIAAHAMTDADCAAAWSRADTNSDGKLTGGEGSNYYSTLNSMEKPVAADSMTKDLFFQHCKSDMFTTAATGSTSTKTTATAEPNAGLPLAGANSFTETQAKDRAAAAGFASVSALKKDESGVWRGTAMRDSKTVNIAIDFKGNVVSN